MSDSPTANPAANPIIKALRKSFKHVSEVVQCDLADPNRDSDFRLVIRSKTGQHSMGVDVISLPTDPYIAEEDVNVPLPLAFSSDKATRFIVLHFQDTKSTQVLPFIGVKAALETYLPVWRQIFPAGEEIRIPHSVLVSAVNAELELASF